MEALHALMAPQTEHARKRLVHGLVTAKIRSRESNGTYRLDYLTMGDDEPSARARVMMPMAGGKRGTYFFPEPGDEVVVAFELGDTNLPVILGAVWNQNDAPPDQVDPSAENNIRTIVSRSGHEVTFDDTVGSEKVTIKTQGGHSLVLDDAPTGPTVTLATAAGVELKLIDLDGSLAITAPLQITLESAIISMTANIINLVTTGTPTASLVTIDGVTFGLHTHLPFSVPALGTTGPVGPPGG